MATTPDNEEPGFEHDENELPADQGGASDESLEEEPLTEDDDGLEEAQEHAAEERPEEGGYQ